MSDLAQAKERRAVGVGEGGERSISGGVVRGGEVGGEEVDAITSFGDGFPSRMHGVVDWCAVVLVVVVGSGGCLDGGDMEEEGEESEIWEFSWKSIGRLKKCIPKKIFYLEEKIKKLRRVRDN